MFSYGYLFLLLQVVLVFSQTDKYRSDGRIVGGVPVNITDFPYQISLQKDGYHYCGGSILSRKWILSAAHCVNGEIPWRLSVRAGSSIRETGGTVKRVICYFKHPFYSSKGDDYDYALVRLLTPVTYGTGIQPITVAASVPPTGTTVTVSGWGALKSGATTLPNQLQAVNVSITDWNTCNSDYNNSLTKRMFCAAASGKDSCQGDSGGPLVTYTSTNTRKQIGIVSFGAGCAQENAPGVYADLTAVKLWLRIMTFIP